MRVACFSFSYHASFVFILLTFLVGAKTATVLLNLSSEAILTLNNPTAYVSSTALYLKFKPAILKMLVASACAYTQSN